jgi:hypothetical protein
LLLVRVELADKAEMALLMVVVAEAGLAGIQVLEAQAAMPMLRRGLLRVLGVVAAAALRLPALLEPLAVAELVFTVLGLMVRREQLALLLEEAVVVAAVKMGVALLLVP